MQTVVSKVASHGIEICRGYIMHYTFNLTIKAWTVIVFPVHNKA